MQKELSHYSKHDILNNEIQMFWKKIDSDPFTELRNKEGFRKRFLEIEI